MEEFTPQFTFHGFRYAEVTGLPTAPGKDAVTGLVFHTDAPFTAKLATGSAMINKLWSNILWGQRSNFVGVPTDCPQRDERLGWMADAQVFWRAASYNMDLAAFSRKFAGDMRGTQVGHALYYGIYCSPGTVQSDIGLRRRMERCRRHHSLDLVAADRRHQHHRAELGGDGEVSRRHRGRQSRWIVEARLRNSLRRLALARGQDRLHADRHCLLGL